MQLSLVAALLPLFTAQAEAAPPPRVAYLEATYASGFYDHVRSAMLALQQTDDGTPAALTFSVQGRKLTARVWRARPSRCGDRISARLNVPDENVVTDVELTDYSHVRCRLYVKHKWHVAVDTREADGTNSRLELEGDPQD